VDAGETTGMCGDLRGGGDGGADTAEEGECTWVSAGVNSKSHNGI
jgi:hypothetical protein